MTTNYNPYCLLPWFSQDNNKRGSQFEDLARWWLVASPTLSSSSTGLVKVVRWEDWPERPSRDLGIDLVGWDLNGRLWAIQCKAYEPSRLVNKSEVSQLVGAAGQRVKGTFFGLIYITASDGYTANAKTVAKNNNVLLLSRTDLDLSSSTLQFPRSEKGLKQFILRNTPTAVRATPKKHQTTAVEETVSHMTTFPRGQLLMACGTGKTLTSLWIKERLVKELSDEQSNAKVVVLLPSISLLSQTLREWAAHRNTQWKQIAVCSDDTVSESRDENFEDMESVDAGFQVTTSQNAIRDFLRNTPGEQIIFSTYHSADKVANAARAEGVTFDLVICDEAHRLAGQAGKSYASVLDEKLFPAHKRLFMTATPKVFSSTAKKTASDEGYLISSMDDAAKFGEVAHRLSFAQAIKDGLLTDFQVVIAVTTDTAAKKLLDEKRFVGLDNITMSVTDLAAALAVGKAAKRHKLTRTISFHSTIKRSKGFIDALEKICSAKLPGLPRSLDVAHVDGSVSATERLRRLDRLKAGSSGFNLLANARCLTEGIDVPSLDGVAFVDPRQSEVDIVQAVGRAIRLSPKKEKGTIIVPVVMSPKDAAEGKLEFTAHKKLRQVLFALRSHDAATAIELDNFVFAQALHAGDTANLDAPQKLVIELDDEKLKEFASKIRTSILKIGSLDALWSERYAAVSVFYETNKRWPTAKDKGSDGILGAWVGSQRAAKRKDKLSPERVSRLEALPSWTWTPALDTWEKNFLALCEFRSRNGRRPYFTDVVEEHCLANWEARQRVLWKQDKLSPERINRLEGLSDWSWDRFSEVWEQNFEDLVSFYDAHKRGPYQRAAGEEGGLAHWVNNQRTAWRKDKLLPERVARLESLPNWTWDCLSDTWEQNFATLCEFHDKHGRWPRQEEDGVQISVGKWATVQRTAFNNGKLAPERAARLDALPGWSWGVLSDTWEQNFSALAEFYSKNQRRPKQRGPGDENRLATWLGGQRGTYKRGTLAPARAERLEALTGMSWSVAA